MASPHDHHGQLAALRSLERMLSAVEHHGLSANEFRVLLALADDSCALVELTDRLDLPAVAVRAATRHLAMGGLIRRRQGARRKARVSLTAAGLTTLRLLTATATHPNDLAPAST